MPTDINSVILIGRLVRDPEFKTLSTTSLVSFTLANNRTYNVNNEKKEETVYIDCTAWGKLAEIIRQYCAKGKQVCISGRLKQNSWVNSEGKKHSKIEVVAENIQLLGNAQGGQSGYESPGREHTIPAPAAPAQTVKEHSAGQPPMHEEEQIPPHGWDDGDDIPF